MSSPDLDDNRFQGFSCLNTHPISQKLGWSFIIGLYLDADTMQCAAAFYIRGCTNLS